MIEHQTQILTLERLPNVKTDGAYTLLSDTGDAPGNRAGVDRVESIQPAV